MLERGIDSGRVLSFVFPSRYLRIFYIQLLKYDSIIEKEDEGQNTRSELFNRAFASALNATRQEQLKGHDQRHRSLRRIPKAIIC